ncbi:MAG: shikimate kinase [Gemmataceae bacterium]
MPRGNSVDLADADEQIEATAGKTIATIFKDEGEPGFRDREAAALVDLCRRDRTIATGGGAVLRPANRELLRDAGFIVWLATAATTSWERLQGDATTASRRPNLTASGGLEEVQSLIAARTPIYRELSHFTINTDTESPEAVASAILTACNGGTPQSPASGASGSSSSA